MSFCRQILGNYFLVGRRATAQDANIWGGAANFGSMFLIILSKLFILFDNAQSCAVCLSKLRIWWLGGILRDCLGQQIPKICNCFSHAVVAWCGSNNVARVPPHTTFVKFFCTPLPLSLSSTIWCRQHTATLASRLTSVVARLWSQGGHRGSEGRQWGPGAEPGWALRSQIYIQTICSCQMLFYAGLLPSPSSISPLPPPPQKKTGSARIPLPNMAGAGWAG